jgi:hypothetical protein
MFSTLFLFGAVLVTFYLAIRLYKSGHHVLPFVLPWFGLVGAAIMFAMLYAEMRPRKPKYYDPRHTFPVGTEPEPAAQRGHIYLMKLDGQHWCKVGITADLQRRTREHERKGWTVYRTWDVVDMEMARLVEQRILQGAKDNRTFVDPEYLKMGMPQGGYTEVLSIPAEFVEAQINGLLKVVA